MKLKGKPILDKTSQRYNSIKRLLNRVILFISILLFLIIVYDIGFKTNDYSFFLVYKTFLFFILSFVVFKYIFRLLGGVRIYLFDYFIISLLIVIILIQSILPTIPIYHSDFGFQMIILLFLIIQLTKFNVSFNRLKLNPPLLFISSFLFLILIGTALLLLPNATIRGISFIDAIFTATSAVCVTGLVVVDTASYFTQFGQFIILILIQLGGLGIMTITTFFSFFFKGRFYFENQLFVKEFVNEERVGEIYRTIVKIISFTLLFEIAGAVLIYYSLEDHIFNSSISKIKFSIFHSVSAFCNAGFSTFTDGLYTPVFRNNFSLIWVICILIIVGGIGFPVIINLYNYSKALISYSFSRVLKRKKMSIQRIITLNTWIVLIATMILLVSGTILYYLTEKDNTLKELSLYGKLISSFFGSVTPRTAGFNISDMSQLTMPTLLLYLLFMWIGASPGGTGGGLKTTTFSVAILTVVSISRNSDRLEIYNREVPNESIKRAFTIIFLSFMVIGIGIFLITLFDPEKKLIQIAFECFSAYSTVGLTMGITYSLSVPSKIVVIVLMVLGRVGTLTLLLGVIRSVNTLNYRLPKENIFIN